MKVTKDNYIEIIEKLKHITDRYKIINIYYVSQEYKNGKYETDYKNSGIKIGRHYVKNKKYDLYKEKSKEYIRKFYFNIISKFFDVTEHYMHTQSRTGFSDDPSYIKDIYDRFHPLISIDIGNESIIVLNQGDEIKFYPFGIFSIIEIEDSKKLHPDCNCKDSTIHRYKYLFIPNIIKKIEDIDHEKEKRLNEWKSAQRFYMKKEMEYYNKED